MDEGVANQVAHHLTDPEVVTFDYDGKDCEVIGEPDKALIGPPAVMSEHDPDLVFLDVQMPGLDGFGVIEAIGADRMPARALAIVPGRRVA